MFIHRAGKSLVTAAAIAALLPGCATNPDGSVNDQQQTVAQGAVAGAFLGALLGAAVSDNKASGALIGAAAGGLIGAGIGSTIAERKAQYANEEDFLVAEIRRNQEFIQEADAQNRQMYQEIAQLDRESKQLRRQYRAGRATRDALTRQQATVEKQLTNARKVKSLTEKQLADANQVYQESRQKRGPQDKYTQQLENDVVKLKDTNQQSGQNVASLQEMYDSMSI